MEWIVLILLGAFIGLIASFVAERAGMPQPLCVLLAVIGALAGAVLTKITGFAALGAATFYFMGSVLAVGLLAGGMLAYNLTDKQPSG